jgi:hypothetical protein
MRSRPPVRRSLIGTLSLSAPADALTPAPWG